MLRLAGCRTRHGSNLAYYFAPPYWGARIASEAFVDTAFARLRLVRLWAETEKGDVASERILQKLGFTYVSRREIPGRVICVYELSRTAREKKTTEHGAGFKR
jgi:RimJ/RimL family protein N-acetyltransferase